MRRSSAFVVVAAVIVVATIVYLVVAVRDRSPDGSAALPPAVTETTPAGTVFVRDTRDGAFYGRVSVVSNGERSTTGRFCDRIDVTPELTMACLEAAPGVTVRSKLSIVDEAGAVRGSWMLPGTPSRTRVSADGRHWAATTFVTGHSYTSARFSTHTVIGSTSGGRPVNLESYALTLEGRAARPVDRNFWGVTFAKDGRTFYATVAVGDRTWLVEGDLAARTVRSVHEEAECPALSPDETRVAYKKRNAVPGATWTLAVLELSSGEETLLTGERSSVDDQVMWLDDRTLLYGLPDLDRPGRIDVWAMRAEKDAEPRLYIQGASSPAVPRR